MHVIETLLLQVEGVTVQVERLSNGSFRKPAWLSEATRDTKRIAHSGEAMMRHGGENTRPWIEEALKKGYHELPGDTPASDDARAWEGWGTALKPAWEPVLVGRKPLG